METNDTPGGAYLPDGNFKLFLSCETLADRCCTHAGGSIETSRFKNRKTLNLTFELPDIYHEYVGPIFATISPDGRSVDVSSTRGRATLSYPDHTEFFAGTFGLSYASCDITVTLQKTEPSSKS